MSTAGVPLFEVRATPKGQEKFVDPKIAKLRHRVFSRAVQIENSLHSTQWKVGMRVGVLEQREQFTGKIPKPTFYTGVVEKIWGTNNDLVTIKYDGHPWALDISFGIENACYCILLPEEAPNA